MDPSIMKLLEEDEDETIHSGADVDAFTAALNRDIEGDTTASTSKPTESKEILSHGSNSTSSQLVSHWQNSSLDENVMAQNQQALTSLESQEQRSPKKELMQHESSAEKQKQLILSPQENKQDGQLQPKMEPHSLQIADKSEAQISEQSHEHFSEDRIRHPDNQHQYPKLPSVSNQQTLAVNPTNNPVGNEQTMAAHPTNIPISNQQTVAANPTNNPVSSRQALAANPANNPVSNQQALAANPTKNPVINQQALAANPSNNSTTRPKQVPFGMLLPVITPHLDKGRAMQLNTIYNRLRKNEIGKDEFVRHMKNIVGDQMLRQAVSQIQMQTKAQAAARNAPTGPHQFQKGQSVRMDPSQVSTSTIQVQTDSSQKLDNRSESQGMHVNQKPSSTMGLVSQERGVPSSSLGGPNKHQQHHTHLPQTSFPLYGSTASNYHSHPYSASSVTSGATSFKSQTQDSQLRQAPLHQAMASTQPGSAAQPMNMSAPMKYEVHNSTNDPRRLQGGSHPHITSHPTLQHNQVPWQSSMSKEQKSNGVSLMANVKHELVDQNREQQYKSQISASVGSSSFRVGQVDQGYTASSRTLNSETMDTQSTRIAMSACTAATHTIPALDPSTPVRTQVTSTSTLGAGINIKTTPKKPSIGQKKPLESLGTPTPPMASKKQRVSGSFQDQSIEQLNDVTAVSGVDLREEEEQLLSGPKVESRASEATRRAVQEEEEKLILQKIPLQKKLANILFSCGVKNISSDVERCLSLCVEERMRGILINLVRLSKQRVDIERPRHRTPITSDVGRQIFSMNQKVKEEWDKKQAEEAEKLRKINEAEGNTGADGDKEKDDGRLKSLKANKEEDDKMRTTAANVAARVAVGGDDALIRFQLMAEQGRQKREGGSDSATFTQLGIDAAGKSLAIGRTTRDNQDTEQRGPSTPLIALGAKKKLGKNPVVLQPKVVRTILVKDVIGLLERETQMSKSPLLYRLYERSHADAAAE